MTSKIGTGGFGLLANRREFVCDCCGDTFTTVTTIEEKETEFRELYGESLMDCNEDIIKACDNCWNFVISRMGVPLDSKLYV